MASDYDIATLNQFFAHAQKLINAGRYAELVAEIQKLFHNDNLFWRDNLIRPFLFKKFLPILNTAIAFMDDEQQESVIAAMDANILYSLEDTLSRFEENEIFCSKLIAKYIDTILQEEYLYFLVNNAKLLEIFKNVIKANFQKQEVFDQVLSFAIKYKSPDLLHFLKNTNADLFNKSISKLDPTHADLAHKLLKLEDGNVTSRCMPKFVKGIGALDYECALLSCAAVADKATVGKKEYEFNPVVLKIEEIDDFIQFIHEHPVQIGAESIKFVITGSHWISGQLEYDENGNLNILIMDSLGLITDSLGDEHAKVGYEMGLVIAALDKVGAKANIFHASERRQGAAKGCSVFALDDCRHLFTCERYLPSQYLGLFDYLRKGKQAAQTAEAADMESKQDEPGSAVHAPKRVTLTKTRLPLYLLKTWQSRKLRDEAAMRKDEATLPINKKSLIISAASAIASYFKLGADSKEMNTRLDEKLARMRENCWSFLVKHTDDEVARSMSDFTLEGFKQRYLHPAVNP